MSYVQQVLQPEETVRFRTTVHWSSFLSAIVALVIGLTLLVWHYMDQQANLLLLIGAMVFGVTGVILAVAAWLKRFGTEVAVTDRRVIYKRGLIQRHTVKMNLDKVESVDVDQSIWDGSSAMARSPSEARVRQSNRSGTWPTLSSFAARSWPADPSNF